MLLVFSLDYIPWLQRKNKCHQHCSGFTLDISLFSCDIIPVLTFFHPTLD